MVSVGARANVITCSHVEEKGQLIVMTKFGSYGARCISRAESLDLALLRLDRQLNDEDLEDITAATFAQSIPPIYSMVDLFGFGGGGVRADYAHRATGHIRKVGENELHLSDIVQNGDSGGPVVYQGEVIGLARATLTSWFKRSGVAIPVNRITEWLRDPEGWLWDKLSAIQRRADRVKQECAPELLRHKLAAIRRRARAVQIN